MELREIFNFGHFNNLVTEKAKLPKYALAKLSYSFAKAGVLNLLINSPILTLAERRKRNYLAISTM